MQRLRKRQKHDPKPRSEKPKSKVGWRAAEDAAVVQGKAERSEKQPKWAESLAKVTTAFVKTVVNNSFRAETGKSRKGAR